MNSIRRDTDAQRDAECFEDGRLLMLHHACRSQGQTHPDAGRIGRILSCQRHADGRPIQGGTLVVEFFSDELVGSATFCLIPVGHWMPIYDWMAEEYEPRAKRRGWRLSAQGAKIFRSMGWEFTAATEGKA